MLNQSRKNKLFILFIYYSSDEILYLKKMINIFMFLIFYMIKYEKYRYLLTNL